MPRVLVIAEAGVNHNGDPALARDLVAAAAEAGADIVKFQTFKASRLVTRRARQAGYQAARTRGPRTQREMLEKLELPPAAWHDLIDLCARKRIAFLSTPFDEESLRELVEDFHLPLLKIPSGEITNPLLLLPAAHSGCRLILSTGMATLAEVETALGIIAFGRAAGGRAAGGRTTGRQTASAGRPPSLEAFREAYRLAQAARNAGSPGGTAAPTSAALTGLDGVSLLHCTTEYPAPLAEVNLRAIDTLRAAFGLEVGLSDHTEGIAVALAAVARGAAIIEKHFTLDRTLPGPDHQASLDPAGLRALVEGVRAVEAALGSPVKIPSEAEMRNMAVVRKSLVALRPIARGERFTPANLGVKRPGTGVSPLRYYEFLGRRAPRDLAADDLVPDLP